jgi:hypothetical protein
VVLREIVVFRKSQDDLMGKISRKGRNKDALLTVEEADETCDVT